MEQTTETEEEVIKEELKEAEEAIKEEEEEVEEEEEDAMEAEEKEEVVAIEVAAADGKTRTGKMKMMRHRRVVMEEVDTEEEKDMENSKPGRKITIRNHTYLEKVIMTIGKKTENLDTKVKVLEADGTTKRVHGKRSGQNIIKKEENGEEKREITIKFIE